MTVLALRDLADPVLRTPAAPVTDFGRDLHRLIEDMMETLHDAPGLGLAAPQVGVGLRVFVYDMYDGTRGHVVNPVLQVTDAALVTEPEGCLSVPGQTHDLARHRRVAVRGVDRRGRPLLVRPRGTERSPELFARCLQHETDHLDGVLYLDRLP